MTDNLPRYIWARELRGKRKFETFKMDYHTRYIKYDEHLRIVNELEKRLKLWEPSLALPDGTISGAYYS